MPRFYFDTHNGDGITLDDHGDNLPSMEAVEKVASVTATMLAADRNKRGDTEDVTVVVRDSTGAEVLTARVSLQIERKSVRS